MTDRDPLAAYRTEVLILLVGSNPLPNYVAAMLLSKPGGRIYLLHTTHTADIAKRLARRLNDDLDIQPEQCEIDASDSSKIAAITEDLLELSLLPAGTQIGLNYTGGTKVMAVIVYDTIQDKYPEGCFSYLDARSLKMAVSRDGGPPQFIPVGDAVQPKLLDLLALHDYRLLKRDSSLRSTPHLPELCQVIAAIHKEKDSFAEWRSWLQAWDKDHSPLPDLNKYSRLRPFMDALAGMVTISGDPTTDEQAVAALIRPDDDKKRLGSCVKFFNGEWLEEYTLVALIQADQEHQLGLGEQAIALNLKRRNECDFEIDVMALRGYQLFVISCIATEDRAKAKEHLFEAYVRARQIGGDEARIGLVCCVEKPGMLQQEVAQVWDAQGKIRVFGRADLLKLPEKFRLWFRDANNKEST